MSQKSTIQLLAATYLIFEQDFDDLQQVADLTGLELPQVEQILSTPAPHVLYVVQNGWDQGSFDLVEAIKCNGCGYWIYRVPCVECNHRYQRGSLYDVASFVERNLDVSSEA